MTHFFFRSGTIQSFKSYFIKDLKLHIVSFDVPYPPNYGGVIDIFYKIKALHKIGVKIYLHTFKYGRNEQAELLKYCEHVYYYKRQKGLKYAISKKPYIVNTRYSEELINNLLTDNFPILFEGLHTTFYLDYKELKNRNKIVRTHNVEHDYYKSLSEIEKKKYKQLYYEEESRKLKKYESILFHANHILAISANDFNYFKNKYNNVYYIPAFHPNNSINVKTGRGKYILFHGNLSVGENIHAVKDLILNVFSKIEYPVIIAGRNPDKSILNLLKKYPEIQLLANPDDHKMTELIRDSHINILTTDQNTGIKLKLIASLFCGRFNIVNDNMIKNTGLENLCIIKNTHIEVIDAIKHYWDLDFLKQDIDKRENILSENFSNLRGANLIAEIL
ncbi:MAG: glycosyltransferase family 1 protein [Bacteroidota bacterium]